MIFKLPSKNKFLKSSRNVCPSLVLTWLFFVSILTFAEGTAELLPIITSADTIQKRAILNVGGTGSGTCGAYGGSAIQRINIEISDAVNERIFIGFNVVSGGPGYFRIFEPGGTAITAATPIPAAGQGFIPYFINAVNGPDFLNASGFPALQFIPSPGVTGKYYIEFNSTGPALAASSTKVGLKIVDITVVDIPSLQVKKGRLSSACWSINAGNIADYSSTFNSKVYVLSSDNFVVSADFNQRGFAPANFRLNFNSYGTQNTAAVYSNRQSRTGDFMTPEYAVYLNNPDSVLHPSASIGQLDTSSLHFSRCKQNQFQFDFSATAAGLVEILYDANANGTFENGTADKRFSAFVNAGINHISWNGIDGSGALIPVNVNANFIIHYAQGYINFPIYDAEVDSGGVLFSNVRPLSVNASAHIQHFDDTLLLSSLVPPLNSNKLPTNGIQYPYQQFNGCTGPCHKWEAFNGNNSVMDFGNLSTVNTYLFAILQQHSFSTIIPDYYFVDAGPLQTLCKGDTVQLSGAITNSLGNDYTGAYQWQGSGNFIPNDSTLAAKYIPSAADLSGGFFRLYLKLRGECSTVIDSVKINLDSPPTAAFAGTDQVVCQNSTFLNATTPGVGVGTWTVLGGTAILDSLNAPASQVQNLQLGLNNLRWKITNGVCKSSSDFVTINFTPVSVSISGIDTNYCATAPAFLLDSNHFATNTSGGNYVFSIDGNQVSTLDASSLSNGNHSLKLTYTEPTAGICMAYDSLIFSVGGNCNKAPHAENDYFNITEDSLLLGTSVLLNDTDANPLDTLTLSSSPLIAPQHGNLTLFSNGTFTYLPNLNFSGTDYFTYQICDTAQVCDSATVFILINSVNDAPIAVADSATSDEDMISSGTLLNNDFDVENNAIFIDTLPSINPQNGQVQIHANGTFTYIPNADFNGIDSFSYRICDNGTPAACSNGFVVLIVNAINDAPVANLGLKTTLEDQPNALNVLSNDYDVDGNLNPASLVITGNGNPQHGTAVVDANSNKIIYTPFANYFGNDTLVYQVCDLGFPVYCDTSITFITVLPVNDAPLATNDFSSLVEDDTLSSNSLLANDSDIDGDSLNLIINPIQAPLHGSVTLTTAGIFTYTPNLNYYGNDAFVYQVCDNGIPQLCSTDTVFLTITPVNDPPVSNNNTVVTLLNTSILATVLGNDFDVDNNLDPASVSISAPPLNGTTQVNSNGTILYTPQNGFFGTDSLLYSVCDSGFPILCTTSKLIIEVGYVNLPPTCFNDSITTNEDAQVTISVLLNDTDPNNNIDQSTIQLLQNAAHGSCTLDYSNGTIQYTPNANYFGFDTLRYVICDAGTISNCDTALVFIRVQSVNDAPLALADTLITDEDFAVFGNLLNNDSDADVGDLLQLSITPVIPPLHGTLVLTNSGSYNYTPNVNFHGTDGFTYEVCDNGIPVACSQAQVLVFVASLNDAPVAVNNVIIVPINSNETVAVLNNDYDVDGNLNPSSLTIINGPTNGIAVLNSNNFSISYAPNPNYFGLDTVSYSVCDSASPALCSQAYLIFNVGATNNPPQAMPDFAMVMQNNAAAISVLDNDFDVDGNLIKGSVDILVNTSNGGLTLNTFTGIITYHPNPGFSGNDTLVYEICDGGLPVFCDTALVVISVSSNLAPVANPDFISSIEDTPVNGTSLLLNDFDPENATISLSIVPVIPPQHGLLSINTNGTYTYFPNLNFNGNDSFIYQICDNGSPVLCDTANVIISITAINDVPVASNDTLQIAQGVAFTGNLLSNDSDVDGPALSTNTSSLNGPLHGNLILFGNGNFTYTPTSGFSGTDQFNYVICDNGSPNLCDTATVFITIGGNAAPQAINDTFNINEDNSLINTSLLVNDSDPEGTVLSLSVNPLNGPLHGTLVLNSNGTFNYSPDLNYFGSDSFNYVVCDGGSPTLCDTALVLFYINPVNDAPQALNDVFSLNSNASLNANVSLNDSDVDNLQLTVNTTPISAVNSGVLNLQANGQFTYIPNTNFIGTDTFSYEICDNGSPGLCAIATVLITIHNRNPIAIADTFSINSSGVLTANCLSNDSDPEGGILSMSTLPVVNVVHGTLVLTANGSFVYTPNSGYSGPDFFYYTACDNAGNQLCSNAKVLIYVLNAAPIANTDTLYATQGIAVTANCLLNDSDAEAGVLLATLLSQPQHGTLVFSANGEFIYTSNADYLGLDSFAYEVCDDGTPQGCDTARILIYISANENGLLIPNAFSPNGDNINDAFEIKGINNFPNNEIEIFDRNGVLVFSAKGYANSWIGLDKNGDALPSGSYFYILDKKDGEKASTGYIVLSR